MFAFLVVTGCVVAPVALIWGWTRWTRQPKQRTGQAILSLIGFFFATASAAVAVLSVAYAQVHHFPKHRQECLKCEECKFGSKSRANWA
jgi:K+-transporting ATPase A subunit